MENSKKENHNNYDEIGLKDLKDFIEKHLYNLMTNIKKHVIYIILISIVGFGVGYFFDKKSTEFLVEGHVKNNDAEEIMKREIITVFNYNSIFYAKELIKAYNESKELKEKGLIAIHIEGLKNLNNLKIEKNKEALWNALSNKYSSNEELIQDEFVSNTFYYYKIEIISLNTFDSKLLWDELSNKINSIPHFIKMRDIQIKSFENRKIEINKALAQIQSSLEQGTLKSKTLSIDDVLTSKDNFTEELMKIDLSLVEAKDIIYEVYSLESTTKDRINGVDEVQKKSYKKLQFPILGLMVFFLIQWMLVINRKYSKK
ncbi:MAG: hypothetical protein LBI72_03845 [Flavobacteriaceae bacterium]|jgi:uncharacterized membrane protein|nr:hypothetical protein [Flavobacteriaceae bacterium]